MFDYLANRENPYRLGLSTHFLNNLNGEARMLDFPHIRRDSGERRDPRGIPPHAGDGPAGRRYAQVRGPHEKKGKRSHDQESLPRRPARRRGDGRAPIERKSPMRAESSRGDRVEVRSASAVAFHGGRE